MQQLHLDILDQISTNKPNAKATDISVVHFGLGRFHRAHQAKYFQDLLVDDSRWGICALSLRSPETVQNHRKQGGVYCLLSHSKEGSQSEIINSIVEAIHVPSEKEAYLSRMANPKTQLCTFTVTEKGYCYSSKTKSLDFDNPVVQTDIKNPNEAVSLIGVLYLGLRARKAAKSGKITLLSCDNLANNGKILAECLKKYVESVDKNFLEYIQENVSFPSSMVDRIVPAIPLERRSQLEIDLGYFDALLVETEEFSQWVIEDNFFAERPNLEGVEFVEDIGVYEEMKLRMLNGSHSFLAYAGYLSDCRSVDECMQEKDFVDFLSLFLKNEVRTNLKIDKDLQAYQDKLFSRFENPLLKHQLLQIAMDASQKIPQRWLANLEERLGQNRPSPCTEFAIASWIRFTRAEDWPLQDPLHLKLLDLAKRYHEKPELWVKHLIEDTGIFSAQLAANANLKQRLQGYLEKILNRGMRLALHEFVKEHS